MWGLLHKSKPNTKVHSEHGDLPRLQGGQWTLLPGEAATGWAALGVPGAYHVQEI
jgi:hypothetical protein